MENFLNLNKLVEGKQYATYRKAIWVYVWLLIFEGALRKWILPDLSTSLLLVRDPIAVWLTWVGLQRGWIKTGYVKCMLIASSISLFFSLLVGHHNLFVGLFGWRIYFIYFPMMFVMAKVLTRDDFLKICRFVLIVSIPMTLLVIAQFYLPQEHWVNRGIGGDMEGAGFMGALGYYRPPGTFSFTSGYVHFQGIVCACLIYFLMKNHEMEVKYRFKNWLLILITACFVISIPTSISRTLVFTVGVYLSFLAVATIRMKKLRGNFFRFLLIGGIAVVAIVYLGIGEEAFDATTTRFDQASRVEGGVMEGTIMTRYFGSLIRAFSGDFPIFGYGMGLGTNVGTKIMGGNMYSFGFNGEEEWSRIMGECGVVGFFIIGARLFFSLDVLKNSYKMLTHTGELIPWIFAANVMLSIPNGQWAVPTDLGMAMMAGTLGLVALKVGQNGYLKYVKQS